MKIRKEYESDVLVIGAGSAGFCAAVAAARNGARVVLAERECMAGGVLTVGGNNSIDEFNNPYLKENKMVIGGIGWELVRDLHARGMAKIPDMDAPCTGKSVRFGVKVNPLAAAEAMDRILQNAGVKILYGVALADTETDGARVTAAIFAAPEGLLRISARVIIDATGDGAAAFLSGAEYELGDGDGNMQPATMRVYPSNSNAEFSDNARRVFLYSSLQCGDNTNHICNYDPTEAEKRTDGEIRARKQLLEMQQTLMSDNPDFSLLATAPHCGVRESRRIVCDRKITLDEFENGRAEGAVCYSFWYVDIHTENGGNYKLLDSGITPKIPYLALAVKGIDNMLVAGRCICADRAASSALRVKASCMAIGQAAGTAAAMAKDGNVHTLDIDALRARLAADGAIVPDLTAPRDFAEMMK